MDGAAPQGPRGLATLARWPQRRVVWLKRVLFLLALGPLVRLMIGIAFDRLGANPVEFAIRNTGDWALIFLCVTLSVTPLRRMLHIPWLLRMRRMFGLYVFFYAVIHVLLYSGLDKAFDVPAIVKDILKRPFITFGFAALMLLVPLAATSTNRIVKRMGAARWQRLHRAIYLIGVIAIVHFWFMKAGKHDLRQPLIYGTVMALLLLYRAGHALSARLKASGTATASDARGPGAGKPAS